MRYDPEKPLAPEIWKALDEGEAALMIAHHHQSPDCAHPPAPGRRAHDAMHLIVENQAATADLPIADALRRLVAEGLTRHEAVHAVGSVLGRYFFAALGPDASTPDVERYYEQVATLTAESWRRSAEPDAEISDRFRALDDDGLIDLLFTEEDRLPREAVDEIVARSTRLTVSLIAIIIAPRTWTAPLPGWWAAVHATFILAAIDDPVGDAALLSALRDADARNNDWILGAMPAVLGARGARLRPTLLGILANRTEPAGVRCGAIDGLAAGTLADPKGRDEVFARIADVVAAATEDPWVREHAGQVLLDFQVRAYEQVLIDFAERAEAALDSDVAHGLPLGLAFDVADVVTAFSGPQDLSRYRDSWLDFYDPDMIVARQARWQREAAERAARERERRTRAKVGRNDPCPCGSGRKHKKCCLGA
jgi:hypothetical protein